MKKGIMFFLIVFIVNIAWAEREIDAIISCNSLYITGADNTLEINLEVQSPDVEWIAFLQFTFPDGVTPMDAQNNIAGEYYTLQFNNVDGQTITWGAGFGDISLGFLPSDGNPYIFNILIDVDASVTESITVNYNGAGDNFGAPPHEFEGTFTIDPTLDNDLVAEAVLGNTTPTEGDETIYNVFIKNQGNLAQAGTDYAVELYNADDDLIGSVPGLDLAPGEQGSVEIIWVPDITGATFIYGVVDLPIDENINNNTTDPFNVIVQSAGTIVISVGSGTELSYQIPANFFYRSSLSECWYYPEEINFGGLITQLGYYTNWFTDLQDMPLRVWMGETTQPQGAIGWIPADQLTLVFDGTIDLSPGENDIFLALDTFFGYSGADNLVIMMERPMDNAYYSSSDTWYTSNDVYHPARTIHYYNDITAPDPYNPQTGNVLNVLPNIGLYFDNTPTGSLEGYVYGNDRDPLVGALVEIGGTTFSTYTDETGYYDFPYLFVDNYDITASIFGYYDTVETVAIIEDQLTAQDIYLDHLPTINVSGHVVTSDTGALVIGADVMLEGYENYEGINTDNSGNFVIPGVYASHTYTITINYTGYETYVNNNVVVGDVDLDMGEIIVEEIAYPVYNVIAEEDHDGNALIVWSSPNENLQSYGIRYIDIGTNPINLRILESYNLHRLLDGDENNPENWTEIAIGLIETSYTDTDWPLVAPGVYRYAVTAVYTNGVEADPGFSDLMYFAIYAAVTLFINTDSGDDPAGASVVLTNQDGNPDHTYTMATPVGGEVFFPQVYQGVYDLEVTLANYEAFSIENINIFDIITIPVELNEVILAPVNPIVENITGGVRLSWTEPGSGTRKLSYISSPKVTSNHTKHIEINERHLMNYNVYVDDVLEGTTTDLHYDIFDLEEGIYLFGVSAYYSSGNESEIVTVEGSVNADNPVIPVVTKLIGNYPNPFNPETTISFSVSEAANVNVEIYNIKGEKVKTLVNGFMEANNYTYTWSGTDDNENSVASGVYFYKMKAGRYTSTKKMILMK